MLFVINFFVALLSTALIKYGIHALETKTLSPTKSHSYVVYLSDNGAIFVFATSIFTAAVIFIILIGMYKTIYKVQQDIYKQNSMQNLRILGSLISVITLILVVTLELNTPAFYLLAAILVSIDLYVKNASSKLLLIVLLTVLFFAPIEHKIFTSLLETFLMMVVADRLAFILYNKRGAVSAS